MRQVSWISARSQYLFKDSSANRLAGIRQSLNGRYCFIDAPFGDVRFGPGNKQICDCVSPVRIPEISHSLPHWVAITAESH